MEEGIYLASFALCALSWGLSPFLMTCGWNTEIADLSLVLPPSTSSNYRVATLLLQLSLPFCLMPHYSTVLSLSKHIDRTSALIPLSDLQITPTPGYHFLCYFYRFVFFDFLTSFLVVFKCNAFSVWFLSAQISSPCSKCMREITPA